VPPVREFPFEAVRDLIGLLRALYAAEKGKASPSPRRLAAIESLAETLRRSRRIAADHDPGTAAYERAIASAESVVPRLADLVTLVDAVAPLLKAAGDRVRGRRSRGASERDVKRVVGKLRS
jgi:hypothetical protein